MALLELDNLTVSFATPSGRVPAVRGIDLRIGEGECVAIVGESGSGKSQTMLACAGLLAANGSTSGSVRFAGEDILGLPEARLERLRGPVQVCVAVGVRSARGRVVRVVHTLRVAPQVTRARRAYLP